MFIIGVIKQVTKRLGQDVQTYLHETAHTFFFNQTQFLTVLNNEITISKRIS